MGITRGLIGYTSPEYAVHGKFSVKSDVFGFGVLLLEIGNLNRRFSHLDHNHNLVGHAWLLWNEEKSLEILHKYLEESCIESQPSGPTMSSIVFLLANEGARLPWPEQPGFFMERCSTDLDTRTRGEQSHTQNEISPTVEVCIQKLLEDRPAISSVLLMLSNEEPTLPQPKEPGLFVKGSSMGIDPLMGEGRSHTRNTITLSTMVAR
ncbi:hypothetical protein ACFX1Q_008202 [Malus domestica]